MRTRPGHRPLQPISVELAHGMSLALESSRNEIDRVRAILREAADYLMAELGEPRAAASRAQRETARRTVIAMQFQDLSDHLLANAQRRIGTVRDALELGRTSAPPAGPRQPLATGETELYGDVA